MQRGETKLHAVAEDVDVFVAVIVDGATQQRLVFIAVGRDVMMAIEPLADRFAGRRESIDGSSLLPFSSVNSGRLSRITATEQLAVP
jgi:hypothetical protein